MDENIMNKYTTLAQGPRDHIQYDQGKQDTMPDHTIRKSNCFKNLEWAHQSPFQTPTQHHLGSPGFGVFNPQFPQVVFLGGRGCPQWSGENLFFLTFSSIFRQFFL